MIRTLLQISSNLISFGIFVYYVERCLTFKRIRIRDFIILLTLFVSKVFVSDLGIPILNLISTFMLNLYLLFRAYGKLEKKIWLFVIFISLSVLSEEVGLFIHKIFLNKLFTFDLGMFLSLLIAKIFLFSFVYVVAMLYKVVKYEHLQIKHVLILMLFPASTILLLIAMRYPILIRDSNILLLISILLLLLANIGCFYEYYMLAKSNKIKTENLLMGELHDKDQKYIEMHKTKMQKNQAFIHDVKKHIAFIQRFIEKDEKIKALEYIKEYLYMIDLNGDIITGNESFDIALSMYMNQIKDNHILIDCSGMQKVDLSWIKYTDQDVIFSNLIENAVESCIQCDNPKITFTMKNNGKKIVFQIANSCNLSHLEQNGSSKQGTERHGYGLKNVQVSLAKHDAMMRVNIYKPTSQYITTILFHKQVVEQSNKEQ